MKSHRVLMVIVLTTLCGCNTLRQSAPGKPEQPQQIKLAPLEPLPAAILATSQVRIASLMANARVSANDEDEEEFRDCEAAIVEELIKAGDLNQGTEDFTTLLSNSLDELGKLSETFEQVAEVSEDTPPEPQPVSEEQIALAQRNAQKRTFDLPVLVTPEVTSLIDYYSGRGRDHFAIAMARGGRFLIKIREELKKANLPLDLAYLPLVESAFNPKARSRARAQGLWQFMVGTGRLYSLRADGLVDERNDPDLATRAAVRHLADLYSAFGDWELSLAAYNSGAGRVQRALRRAKNSSDFWSLRRFLPRETRNYVPAFWAALVVAKNPENYGFAPIQEIVSPCVSRVEIEGAIDLIVLAEKANVDADSLADLNPALVHRLTPARGSYPLAIPCGQEQLFRDLIATIPPSERVKRFLHVVRPGDTPSAIARLYGSTPDAIMSANGIKSARSLRIGQTLVVPRSPLDRGQAPAKARKSERQMTAAIQPDSGGSTYTVQPGDTLYRIARRFGTSPESLQKLNSLHSSRINPGDVLQLPNR